MRPRARARASERWQADQGRQRPRGRAHWLSGPSTREHRRWQAGQRRGARVREAVSVIWVVLAWSNGGDQRGGVERLRVALVLSAAVRSPELGQACARVVPGSTGLGREGENDTTNLVTGKWPRIRGQRGENGREKASGGPEELRWMIPATGRGLEAR
jgi:hypothetical protein